MHGEDQTHQSKIMIAVQVADEDVIDPVEVSLHPHKLHLRGFAAIHQECAILNFNVLS